MGENKNRARDLVADLLQEDIEDDKNILNVREVGFQERSFEILLEAKELEKHHVGVNEVVRAIESRNVNIPGGHLQEGPSQKLLRVEGKVQNIQDLQNLFIRSNDSGEAILLKDVATLRDGEAEKRVIGRYNGQGATLLVATKKPGPTPLSWWEISTKKLQIFGKNIGDSSSLWSTITKPSR